MLDQQSKLWKITLSIVFIVVLVVAFAKLWVVGPDYYYYFRPVTEAFFKGETRLYDGQSKGFYNAPWLVFILYPTTWLPLRYGQAMLLTASLLCMLFVSLEVSKTFDVEFSLIAVALAVANVHTFDLLVRANIDGLLLLGIGLALLAIRRNKPLLLGFGFLILAIKPINVILPAMVFIKMVWHWPLKDKLRALVPVIVVLFLSLPVFGWDWPLRYFDAMQQEPAMTYLQTSLWRIFAYFDLQTGVATWLFVLVVFVFGMFIVISRHVDQTTLALALTTNLVFSPYTLGSHYVLLIPAFIILSQSYKPTLLTWLLTLTPLLRISMGFEIAWIDILYPTVLMIGAGCLAFKKRRQGG